MPPGRDPGLSSLRWAAGHKAVWAGPDFKGILHCELTFSLKLALYQILMTCSLRPIHKNLLTFWTSAITIIRL